MMRTAWIVLVACAVAGCDGGTGGGGRPDGGTGGGGRPDGGTGGGGRPDGGGPPGPLPADWYQRANFIEWHFNPTSGERFTDVTAAMDEIHGRGPRALLLYSPYHGDVASWLGAVPIDFYATHPAAGTLEDYAALIDAAHQRGIAVIQYLGLYNLHTSAPYWQQAVQDVAAGRDTHESRTFRWAATEAETTPLHAMESGWAFEPTAGKWFATSWGFPAFDFARPDALEESTAVLNFWLDYGVDGLEYDAPPSMIGVSDEDRANLLGALPASRGATFRFAEGLQQAEIRPYAEKYGVNFGMLGQDNDDQNIVNQVSAGITTVDVMEQLLVGLRDWAVARGGGATRLMVYDPDEDVHLFNGAVLAGCGVVVEYLHSIEAEEDVIAWKSWAPSRQAKMTRLMRAVGDDPAQAPGGGRTRLPCGTDPKHYAVKRTSLDGTRVALNVFNFKSTPDTVVVDLTDSGITVPQTPYDTYAAADGPPISGAAYSVALAARGFRLLDVQTDAP